MRGVNKLVMEIKSDGEYFEKALLFLKPSSEKISQHDITNNAEQLLSRLTEKRQRNKRTVFSALLWSTLGAGMMFIFMQIMNCVF